MEEWRSIKGYEGVYQVSNLGNVRSLNYRRTGNIKNLELDTHSQGYKIVYLHSNGKREKFRVHRLVALAFIKNKLGKKYVNHIDGNKSNNSVSNLEWVTSSENQLHAYKNGLKYRNADSLKVKIKCIQNGVIYDSITQCCNELGLSTGNVCEVLGGRRKQTKGYTFKKV